MVSTPDTPIPVRILRSAKRHKTVQARCVDGLLEVLAPAAMSDRELVPYIRKLGQRLERRRAREALDHAGLERRAGELNRRYFDGALQWTAIRWSQNQRQRFGSCTPARGTIRISDRLRSVPAFVLDYVLVHELAHLLEPDHGTGFQRLVDRYPKAERARGYLMALGYAQESDGP